MFKECLRILSTMEYKCRVSRCFTVLQRYVRLSRIHNTATCHTLISRKNSTNNLTSFSSSDVNAQIQVLWSILLYVVHLQARLLLLIGWRFSTANQNFSNNWYSIATQRANLSTPQERALKAELDKMVPEC